MSMLKRLDGSMRACPSPSTAGNLEIEVAEELDTLFANDRDSPTKDIVRFIPNRRLKAVLVISARPEYLRRAQVFLRRLDTATRATVKQVFIYPVRSRPAPELARLLHRIYGGQQDQMKTPPKAPVSAPSPMFAPTPVPGAAGTLAGRRAAAAQQQRSKPAAEGSFNRKLGRPADGRAMTASAEFP
jgi:hypothetical protein